MIAEGLPDLVKLAHAAELVTKVDLLFHDFDIDGQYRSKLLN